MGETQKLRKGFSLIWGSRTISLSLALMAVAFITYFATDTLGLNPALVGTLLLASKIFDGITDLIAGYIIDHSNTKWGKARPYELFNIPLWLCTFLIYMVPDVGTTGKAVWLFIMYTLINSVCVTFLYGSDAVYLKRAVLDGNKRNSVLSIVGFAVAMISTFGYIILPTVIAKMGGTQGGWIKISLVMGVPCIFIGLIRFFLVKEVENVEEEAVSKSVKAKDSLKILFSNKYVLMLAAATLLNTVINTLAQSSATYYFTWTVGDLSLLSLVSMAGIAGPVVLLFFPTAMRKMGSMKLTKIGLVLGVIGSLIRFVAGSNLVLLIIANLLAGVAVLPLAAMVNIYLIDCMEYSFLKTGKLVEGVMVSLNNFCSKLGGAFASGGLGILMGMAGYDGMAAVQGSSALTAILLLYSLIPAAIFGIMLIILHFYDLDKRLPEMRAM